MGRANFREHQVTAVKILFASSEATPLIKTGGLADVSGSLPLALRARGDDARLVLPAYPAVLRSVSKTASLKDLQVPGHKGKVSIHTAETDAMAAPLYLVDAPGLFDRDGNPYSDASGRDYPDNARRFAVFCRAVVALALGQVTDWRPELVHCNDWQTGLVPPLLAEEAQRPGTLFTIHNLAYQGLFDPATFDELALPPELWAMQGLEFHGQFSFIKGGIAFSDMVNAVSPTYAREICGPELGYGLDGLLRHRGSHLVGVLNGIDSDQWNPATDPHLPANYDCDDRSGKAVCKAALQAAFGLPQDPDAQLFAHIGRLVPQKGADLIMAILPSLMTAPDTQLVILGSGDPALEEAIRVAAEEYPQRVAAHIGYDEPLSHLVEAGSDVFLMPSRFEPCGLNQMYSLRYGSVPVVHKTGGLADTVVDASSHALFDGTATGFLYEHADAEGLWWAVERAIGLYRSSPAEWEKLLHSGMTQNFDWQVSADSYRELYRFALSHPASNPISQL